MSVAQPAPNRRAGNGGGSLDLAAAVAATATPTAGMHPLCDLEGAICDLSRMAQIAHHYAIDHSGERELILFAAARILDMADDLKAAFYAKRGKGLSP